MVRKEKHKVLLRSYNPELKVSQQEQCGEGGRKSVSRQG